MRQVAGNGRPAAVRPLEDSLAYFYHEYEECDSSPTSHASSFSNLNAALATVRIKRIDQAPPVVFPQAVVIPDDGSGDREVRLESSTDMIHWTTTRPGLFGSCSASRFFRVRVTQVDDPGEK